MPVPDPNFGPAMVDPMRLKLRKKVNGFDPLNWKPSQNNLVGAAVSSAIPTEAMDAWTEWLKKRGIATKLGDTPGSTSLADLEAFLASLFRGR